MRSDHPISLPGVAWAKSVLAAARAATIGQLGAGLAQHATPTGRSLRKTSPASFLARIVSGPSGGPYAFRRVFWRDPDWVDRTSTNDPAVAYQANLQDVPDDKIVRMFPVGLPGEYRFQTPRSGLLCNLRFRVIGCNDLFAGGVTVTLYAEGDSGGTPLATMVSSWIVHPAGNISFPLPAETYDVVATRARFANFTGSFALECDPSNAPILQMEPSELSEELGDYICPCGPCAVPIPKTLKLYNGRHSIDLVWDEATSNWKGNNAGETFYTLFCSPFFSDPPGTYLYVLQIYDTIGYIGEVGVTVAGDICLCPPSAPGIVIHFPASELGVVPVAGDTSWNTTIHEDGALPAAPAQVVVRVHAPDCGETEGAPIVGATVTLYRQGDPTPIDTGTTDGAGLCTLDLDGWGGYRIEAEDTVGCTGETLFSISPCMGDSDPVERDVTLCCATACVPVVDDVDDSPMVGATVSVPGLPDATTDIDGLACFTMTSAQMLALPTVGGNCTTRRIRATVTHVDLTVNPVVSYLNRCVDIDVTCRDDGTGTPTEVRILRIPNGYLVGGCCLDDGCEQIGPQNRGLVPEAPDSDIQIDTRDVGGSVTNTFRFTGQAFIDYDEFIVTGVTTYNIPCQAPTIAPTYLDINDNPVAYLSFVGRVELCRANGDAGRVRVRIFRGAGCPGFTDWDSVVGPDDLDYDFELPEGVTRICYGEEIDETGTFAGDNDTWSVSMVPP